MFIATYLHARLKSPTADRVAEYSMPTRQTVELAASMVGNVTSWTQPRDAVTTLPRTYELTVAPGVLIGKSATRGLAHDDDGWSLDWTEGASDEPTRGRTRDSRQRLTAAMLRNDGASTGKRAAIMDWSRKSRLNMLRQLATFDWAGELERAPAGWRPVMLTLTLPREWELLAPTGGHVKAMFERFDQRWKRKYGQPWAGVWKLEYQGRGAPHLHLYGIAPAGKAFQRWLSEAWTAACFGVELRVRKRVVITSAGVFGSYLLTGRPLVHSMLDHLKAGTGVDWAEGVRAIDPRSIALYFFGRSAAHNLGASKEYQHRVPELHRRPGAGPGRWWGVRGVERVRERVELDATMFVRLRRLLRRHAKANGRPLGALAFSRWQGFTVLNADASSLIVQAFRWSGLDPGDPVPRGVDPATGERVLVGPVGQLP